MCPAVAANTPCSWPCQHLLKLLQRHNLLIAVPCVIITIALLGAACNRFGCSRRQERAELALLASSKDRSRQRLHGRCMPGGSVVQQLGLKSVDAVTDF